MRASHPPKGSEQQDPREVRPEKDPGDLERPAGGASDEQAKSSQSTGTVEWGGYPLTWGDEG